MLFVFLLMPPTAERFHPIVHVERMTHREASAIVGKLHTFRVTLASTADSCDGFTIYEVVGPDDAATYTVWLPTGNEQPDTFSVEGTLRIISHPPCKLHNGFVEDRITARH